VTRAGDSGTREVIWMRAEQISFSWLKGTKWCPGCSRQLPVEDFGKDAQRVDGLAVRCRACRAEDGRRRRRQT
jgi:hypothetical protein